MAYIIVDSASGHGTPKRSIALVTTTYVKENSLFGLA